MPSDENNYVEIRRESLPRNIVLQAAPPFNADEIRALRAGLWSEEDE
jgi:hypothetical protein